MPVKVIDPAVLVVELPTVAIEPGTLAANGDEALRRAARLAATESFPDQIGFLLDHVGGKTVAAALGLSDTRQLTKWRRGLGEPKAPSMAERVHLLFQVCYAITCAISGASARRFLVSGNPDLADEAPLMLLRGDVADARVPLLGAVRRFLE